VLITGASGGVGSYAVQLAKAFGAEVTGVVQHRETRPGAVPGRRTMSSTTPGNDFADGVHRYDLIIDIAGNPALSRLRRALAPAGTAVIVGARKAAAGQEASAGSCARWPCRRSCASG